MTLTVLLAAGAANLVLGLWAATNDDKLEMWRAFNRLNHDINILIGEQASYTENESWIYP